MVNIESGPVNVSGPIVSIMYKKGGCESSRLLFNYTSANWRLVYHDV